MTTSRFVVWDTGTSQYRLVEVAENREKFRLMLEGAEPFDPDNFQHIFLKATQHLQEIKEHDEKNNSDN